MAKIYLRLLCDYSIDTFDLTEIKDLMDYFEEKGWILEFKRQSDNWIVQFVKELKEVPVKK